MRNTGFHVLSVISAVACALTCLADTIPQQQNTHDTVAVELKPDPLIKAGGKIAAFEGTADSGGLRYEVSNLDVNQPVFVALFAADPSKNLSLQLVKYNWNDPDRSGGTADGGAVSFRIRTEGDLSIAVRSEGRGLAPFYLLIWAGDVMQRQLPSVVVPMSEYRNTHGAAIFGIPVTPWTVGSGTLLVIGLVLVGTTAVRKRRSSHAPQ